MKPNIDLPYMMRSPDAPFIRAMQEWVWRRYPTRQLSAGDVFYVLKWASSGVPVSAFVDGFEALLRDKPHFFDDGFGLSKLRFEASRIISGYRRIVSDSETHPDPIVVDDPYEVLLSRLAACGRMTENDVLRNMLRETYRGLLHDRDDARRDEPKWDSEVGSFYRLEARACLDWNRHIDALCDDCFGLLSPEEQERVSTPSREDRGRMMFMGDDAVERYKLRMRRMNTARYMGFEELVRK